jgi:hypothetical protein
MTKTGEIPEYMKRWPGLYVRQGGRIVPAPAEDEAVARMYPQWIEKGSTLDGKRLTIMTKKTTYKVNEEIRVIHVVEIVDPGRRVYIMGPKPVFGEHIDGRLVTEPVPEGEDPLVPQVYDGVTLPSPAVDYNYDITSYRFSKPGTHQLHWQLNALQSNMITLQVTD